MKIAKQRPRKRSTQAPRNPVVRALAQAPKHTAGRHTDKQRAPEKRRPSRAQLLRQAHQALGGSDA